MPALNLSIEDRKENIELDLKIQKLAVRAELLEQAVFKQGGGGLGRTIFDDYNERMCEHEVYLKAELSKIQSTQMQHKTEID